MVFPAGWQPNLTPGAQILHVATHTWRLSIPEGEAGSYRLAQLDDYGSLRRKAFQWQASFHLSLDARASQPNIHGTWGFGLWNDPFSMGILNTSGKSQKSKTLRFPVLPETAWFFYASPPSYLSLRDDLPAQGWLAAVFHSKQLPAIFLAPAILGFPLLFIPPGVKLVRKVLRQLVKQESTLLMVDPSGWHHYELSWEKNEVGFRVDGQAVLQSALVPKARLGAVIWIDNQFLASTPDGQLKYGTLPTTEKSWIEVRDIQLY